MFRKFLVMPTEGRSKRAIITIQWPSPHSALPTPSQPHPTPALQLTDFRQALEANICLTREGRHMTPGLSLSMKISSSMSWGPNVQFLLVGKEISLALSVTGAERIKRSPCFEKCVSVLCHLQTHGGGRQTNGILGGAILI